MKDPGFIYGTAWKTDRTTSLVEDAYEAGFRAFDTANQPKHYNEPGLGSALKKWFDSGVQRDDLWIQTKFTPIDGHDNRVPYDPARPVAEQVQQSFASSLEHLHVDYLDSYLLHGPYSPVSLTDNDWSVWKELEKLYKEGKAKKIGVSNVTPEQVKELIDHAEVKPMVVQNRCYASRLWDKKVRDLCREHKLMYQGFSLLTANLPFLQSGYLRTMAAGHGATTTQMVFRFAQSIGMTPLTGTTSTEHMNLDLACSDFNLTDEELANVERIATRES